MNLNGRLVVGSRGVNLGLAGRDGGVAVDHLGHHAAHGFNAQGKRGDVEEQNALNIAGKHAALNSRANSDDLVGVHRHVRLLARHGLGELLDSRHTGGAANENDLVDVARAKIGIFQCALNRLLAAVEQIFRDALELSAGQRVVKVLRTRGVGRDERQVDGSLRGGGKLHLRLLGGFLQALQSHLVFAQIDAAVVGSELVGHPVDDAVVPVVAAQVVVASSGQNLEHTVAELKHGNVERAAAKVEHEDLLIFVHLVEAVSQSSSGRLVDNTLHLEASDFASVFGGLTLSIVEVCRNGNDGLGNRLAHALLGVSLQLLQNHGRNFLGSVFLAIDVDDGTAILALHDIVGDGLALFGSFVVAAADEALHGRNGVLRVGDSLVLSGLANNTLAVFAEALDRRSGAVAFGVHQNGGLIAFHNRHRGVRGAQVDTQNLAHIYSALSR